jgi:AmmeMemoRadiSam system protein B
MIRKPSVAGQFYSSSAKVLSREVAEYCEPSQQRERVIGMVSPHAGLMYSGSVAGALYSRIEFPETLVLIGPNHTGLGKPVSIMSSGEWEIPTGRIKINRTIAKAISEYSEVIEEDSSAHLTEHSLEVQLPFIRYFSEKVSIVPIIMMTGSLDSCRIVGEAIADSVIKSNSSVTIVASSDMSHYEPDSVARSKDRRAIDRILSLDPEGLFSTVVDEKISMCGFIPAATMLFAAGKLGAKDAVLVKYMTSGDINGDYSHVVGYAGIMVR